MNPDTLKRRWLREEEDQIDAAIEALFQHRHGRRLLWWILELGKIGQNAFANNALAMSFTCGEQNVGQRFLDRIIRVNPQGYVEMMKEQNDERGEHERNLADARADRADYGADGGDADGTDRSD